MKTIFAVLCAAVLLGGFAVAPAGATNGMDMIGYGTRAIGMGGADVAVAGDAGNVSGNPAAVSQAAASSAEIGLTLLMPSMSMTHDADGLGPTAAESIDSNSQYFFMPQLGYVHRLKGSPLALGFGLYAQGGMGVDFHGVNPGNGTQDELTSQVSFMRLNPIVSYQVNDNVSLGATLMIGYAQCRFSMYPNTFIQDTDPNTKGDQSFGGMDVTGLHSLGFAGRVGAQVKVGEMVRLGAMYTSKSTIDLGGGTAEMNFGPNGTVKYDAEMQDFTWPQEVEAGIAVLPIKGLTVAADVKWINWAATIDQPKVVVSNPDAAWAPATPFPGGSDTRAFNMAWNNQWVYAIGVEYAINGMHALRAGYNYGKSPVPDDNLNPLFPATVEHHVTLGYGLTLGNWGVNLAYEHAFKNTQVNNTDWQANDFGPGLEISHSQNTFSLDATYRY